MNPKSLAIVGASRRPTRGTRVLRNLRKTGFSGNVYGVNPRYDEIEGFPAFPSLTAIPEVVDCAVLAIPAEGVAAVLEDAYEIGTRSAVILSSGFGEGRDDSDERVHRLKALVQQGMNICGPNCYGILNLRSGASVFSGHVANPLVAGNVGFVSQSGGLTNVIADSLMEDRHVGFSHLVSCGNQIGVAVEDYLSYLVEDPNTSVVAAFVEGLRDPEKLARVGYRASELGKPIITLASGRSPAGREAVRSHTGALSGATEVMSALLRACGIIEVHGVDELIETIALFSAVDVNRPVNRDVTLLTGFGGEASHVADAAQANGVAMAPLSQTVTDEIGRLLPDFGTPRNPIDGTGTLFEDETLFPALFGSLLGDDSKSVIAVNANARLSDEDPVPEHGFARAIAAAAHGSDRTIVAYATSALAANDRDMIRILRDAGVPYLAGTQRAMRAIANLHTYQERPRQKEPAVHPVQVREIDPLGTADGELAFLAALNVLRSFDLPMADTELAGDAPTAVAAAERLGYPVAVKVEARGLLHKSDIGGVVIGCKTAAAVEAAYASVTANAATAGHGQIAGVLVQAMPPPGVEIIAGITVDPVLGPAVVVGLGGIYVELLRDVVTEVPPFTHTEAISMVRKMRGIEILEGARGTEPVDIDALAQIIVSLGDLALATRGQITSLELNPVIVSPQGAVAVDALIELEAAPQNRQSMEVHDAR